MRDISFCWGRRRRTWTTVLYKLGAFFRRQFGADDLAGEFDGQVGVGAGELFDGSVGGRADVTHGTLVFALSSDPGFGDDFLLGAFGILPGFVEHRTDLIGGVRPACVRTQRAVAALLIAAAGRLDVVGNVLLAPLSDFAIGPQANFLSTMNSKMNTTNVQIAKSALNCSGFGASSATGTDSE